jgi:2-C-methyl-D-erythritol 2,4-cyclodiphosphate synthase
MLDRLRIGTGYDVHAFEEGGPLILGGVELDYSKRLAGHSDADAVLHAVVDAILGALNRGDIGEHFPSSDPEWKGAPSTKFLGWTKNLADEMQAQLLSIDVVIMAQEPKLKPYMQPMRSKISEILGLDEGRISLKSTTTDQLGFVGRKEGIAVQAVCLLALPEAKKA